MNIQYLALNFQLREGSAPEWIELIPAGDITGRDGREWHNDKPDAIVNAFALNKADIPLDIEHATELKAPKGEPAPAQGWITALENRGGAIWGQVAWNSTGRTLVESRAYRYVSPAFRYDKQNRRVLSLKSVGLTNSHNLELPALNAQTQPEEMPMEIPVALLLALGLSENASEAAALNAIAQLKNDKDLALNQAQNPSLEKFVPVETHNLALNRAETAENKLKELHNKDVASIVDAAIAQGKVAPANKDMYLGLCRSEEGLAQFKQFVETAPAIATGEQRSGKKPGTTDQTALNAEEAQVAAMFGNSVEDLAKYGQ